MTPIIAKLARMGITAQDKPRFRSRCPDCSDWRINHTKKCLTVVIESDTRATVKCYHCTPEVMEITA